jgi:rhamnose transport system permease protein
MSAADANPDKAGTNLAGREAAPPRPLWHVVLVRPETMTLLLLVLGVIVASQLSPYFLDISYILRSFTLSAEFAIVALVLTMVIIAGEIDLSPAANMALSACLFAWAQAHGVPMPLAIGIGLLAGLAMGALNALMVIPLQLPSIIVTIGTLTLYRGLAQVIAGDRSIRVPDWFIGIDRVLVLGVLLMGCVQAALPLLGIPGTAQNAIFGAVILVALLIDRSVRQQGIAQLKRVRA